MKLYKVTIANGNYPLSYTCDTIADAYDCLRTFWHRPPGALDIDLDKLMTALVGMRRWELEFYTFGNCEITVTEEADADADLD